ncbi:MAG: hypothetical protein V4553_17585 [Bacteroidota bacterium]
MKKFSDQDSYYLNIGGNDEYSVRSVASEALAFSVTIKTGIYNEKVIGVPLNEAIERDIKLIRSTAYHHKANVSGGWGDAWQSTLWASTVGSAGWLMWDKLADTDRVYVCKMIEYEANRMNNYVVPYLRDKAGNFMGDKGDSKAEENAWNATILQLALAMMPDHPNKEIWTNKNIELILSANIRPQDVNSDEKFNGKKLKDIINGSNYNSDGTVTNHGIIHPDYMTCTNYTFALLFALAERPTPKAAFYNIDVIYKALVDLKFPSPPNLSPGGTVYTKNSAAIYYPYKNDWGRGRKMHFALMDCQVNAFKQDYLASENGAYWEKFHAQAVLDMQQRSDDGRCYQTLTEDNYRCREEWVACNAAHAYLTKWIMKQHKFSITNKAR